MFIINNVQLKQFYQECQKDKNIAIDTEFFWTDTYQPILCLVQIANSNKVVILDVIKYKLDLDFLKKLLINHKILKIFHSAKQDIQVFFNLFKTFPKNIFDIQLGVLPLGYDNSTSLKTLCKDFLNINLNKDNQFIDWRRRPLNSKQIEYAKNDVKYLIMLYQKIKFKLKKSKRETWIADLQKKLTDKSEYLKHRTAWKKINFLPQNIDELSNLKKLSAIREVFAKKENKSIKKIISNKEIVKLCKTSVAFSEKKKIITKIENKRLKKYISKLNLNNKLLTGSKTLQLTNDQKTKIKKIRIILEKKAYALKIQTNLIANKNEIIEIVKKKNISFFNGWRNIFLDNKIKQILKD